jgi:hypothetical protein
MSTIELLGLKRYDQILQLHCDKEEKDNPLYISLSLELFVKDDLERKILESGGSVNFP